MWNVEPGYYCQCPDELEGYNCENRKQSKSFPYYHLYGKDRRVYGAIEADNVSMLGEERI